MIVLLDFFSVGYRRLLPTIMAAAFAISGTKTVSGWLRCKNARAQRIISPAGSLISFFPTLVQDFSIRQAMRFRGISLSAGSILLHPLQSAEYF